MARRGRLYEAEEQALVAQWLDERDVLFTATAGGGQSSAITGARLRRMGVKMGVPDLLIFDSPPRRPGAHGVALEMKRAGTGHLTTGKPSEEQVQWLAGLAARCWLTRCCHGHTDAIRWLTELGW